MFETIILWVMLAVLGCIGFVQAVSWIGIRMSGKGNRIYRVIPIGGEGKNTGEQMALMYTCLQWEANPSRQVFVLYDAGLDEQGLHDCTVLAQSAGVRFVRSPEELSALLQQ